MPRLTKEHAPLEIDLWIVRRDAIEVVGGVGRLEARRREEMDEESDAS